MAARIAILVQYYDCNLILVHMSSLINIASEVHKMRQDLILLLIYSQNWKRRNVLHQDGCGDSQYVE